jgi:spermidine/putrescine transport system permease protein
MRRIIIPHLYPAIGAAGLIAFFQSVENYNITLFTRGTADTLTVYVGSKIRTGITPTMNALALILILLTVAGAVWYEIARRRAERQVQRETAEREAMELVTARAGELVA